MTLYARFARTQAGSAMLFGGSFFAATLISDGIVEAATAGSLAAASWFAIQPVLKRLVGGLHGA